MAFGKRYDLKERNERRAGIEGTRHPEGAHRFRKPAMYHVFARRSCLRPDGEAQSGNDGRPTAIVRKVAAAGGNVTSEPSAGDDAKLLGSGFRVYKSQSAFASRHRKQIEIEALQVQGCIVVTFTNFTRRVVGLLRFDGGEADGHLLPAFVRTARAEVGVGDRVRLEVLGGAFTDREARPDTVVRRNKVLLALERIVRAGCSDQAGFEEREIGVGWTPDANFNLRIRTWDGDVSIASRPTKTGKTL